MNQHMSLIEFFSMEASGYLERLDALVSAHAGPDRDEFVRVTRALRGSALMANQQTISQVAAALENVARGIKEGRTAWDQSTRLTAIRGVDGLKILVRNVREWSPADDERARTLAEELGSAAGAAPTPAPVPGTRQAAPGVDAGTRAFIAREGATVASALDQAAKSLQHGSTRAEPLENVLRYMQPLRGIAVLTELPPLPDLLEGIERAVGMALRGVRQPNEWALLFDVAARGLSRAAQEVAASGRPEPDSHEAREFAHRLGEVTEVTGEVVPIQSLYHDDDGPHIVKAGTPAAGPGRLVQLELVAHGEHLRQAADELERAQWDTQREMRALALTSTFRALETATGGPLAVAVATFAAAAREAVRQGAPVHLTGQFVGHIREAGSILSDAADSDEHELADRLTRLTATLVALPAPGPATEVEPAGGPIPRPRAPSAAVEIPAAVEPIPVAEAEPTPIEPHPVAPFEPVPSAAREPAPIQWTQPRAEPAAATEADLVESWAEYERLLGFADSEEHSIGGFIAAMAQDSDVTAEAPPAPTLAEAEPVGSPAVTSSADETIVPIADLRYTGEAAERRAVEVRSLIQAMLADPNLDRPVLTDLIDELLELVNIHVGHA